MYPSPVKGHVTSELCFSSVWAQTHIWKTVWGVTTKPTSSNFLSLYVAWTKRSGAVSSPGVSASNTGSLQACWVIIEAANENQRLTKAELMTSAFLGGTLSSPSASPQQVTRCQKNTCQTLFWEMKSCVWAGRVGVFVRISAGCGFCIPNFGDFNHLTRLWLLIYEVVLICVLVVLWGPPSAVNKHTYTCLWVTLINFKLVLIHLREIQF